jgi:hypothetical protein
MAVNTDLASTKQLNKHAMPIIILSVCLCVFTAIGINHFIIGNINPKSDITQLLTERLLNIKPAADGLFRVSRYQTDSQADSGLLTADQQNVNAVGAVNSTGEITNLDAMTSVKY